MSKNLITRDKMNIIDQKFDRCKDEILGISCLTTVNRMSSPRENMFNSHVTQHLMIEDPEIPLCFTGYEREVGRFSMSYWSRGEAYRIVEKITKFPSIPNMVYVLIIVNEKGFYDVVYRKHAVQLSEDYGYVNNNEVIDSKSKNDIIYPGEVLYRSSAFDEHMNWRYGKNANVLYMDSPGVTEDAIIVSESFAKKTVYYKVDLVEIPKNTNNILLNIYGNDTVYKCIPDIGCSTYGDVVCAKRTIHKESMLQDLLDKNLSIINYEDDDVFYCLGGGHVIDIDIYCNKKLNEIERTPANIQLLEYIENQIRFYKEIKKSLQKIIKSGNSYSDELLHLYHRADDLSGNKQFINNTSKFEDTHINLTILKKKCLHRGNKLSGRYGNKGIIGAIYPDNMMPVNQYGERVDIIASPQGTFARLNIEQWYEQTINFITHNVIRDIMNDETLSTPTAKLLKIADYVKDVVPEYGQKFEMFILSLNDTERMILLNNIMESGMYINEPPFNNVITYDKILYLKNKYKKQTQKYEIYVNGVKIPKKLIFAKMYMMVLKHTPEGKYSIRSIGMVSSLGQPTKSIRYKKHNSKFNSNPIRFGEMEIMNLYMANKPKLLAKFLSMYSNNRDDIVNMIKECATGDPTENNVYSKINTDDKVSTTPNKILNNIFNSIGLELVDDEEKETL